MRRIIGDLLLVLGIVLGAAMVAVAIVEQRACPAPAQKPAVLGFDVRIG